MRKKHAVVALLGSVALTGCSVFGVRRTPEPEYSVIDEVDEVEVREYDEMILATTRVSATDYDRGSTVGFRRLARYIFGKNSTREEIGMTAPVYQRAEPQGEKIGMTAPVLMGRGDGDEWVMSFVMPSRYTMESLPRPLEDTIELEQAPGKRVAVLRFRGRLTDERYAEKARELLSRLESSPWEATSEPRLAGYDPPFTIPALRRNEVQVEVAPRR